MASAQSVVSASRTKEPLTTALRRHTPTTVKLLLLLSAQLPLLHASPLHFSALGLRTAKADPLPAKSPTLWIYFVVAVALVLIGGAFAGLTIALMGQVMLP